ncbi:MAG: energy transducer TonB [Lewinellaceae bacterium]|nr:energy transducer TonB [Lewinellaceae bacterium]
MRIIILSLLCLFLARTVSGQARQKDPVTGKYGFVDNYRRVLIPFEYTDLPTKLDTLMVAQKGLFSGVINANGETVVPFEYKHIRLTRKPEGHQFGFAIVSNSERGNCGIVNRKGELVLPMKYDENTHVLDPNLLVGRLPGDTVLQFFDARGKLLFKIPGKRAFRGFNENSIQIELNNLKLRYADKSGRWMFPDNLPDARWTDGRLIIYGQYENYGIITFRGDTVLPLEYRQVSPALPGQFRVGTDTYEHGIVDEAGQYIIPLGKWDIVQYDGLYSVCEASRGRTCALYDPSGKQILPFEYEIREVAVDNRHKQGPDCFPERYLMAMQKDKPYHKGLYASAGKPILPVAYSTIFYRSEKHPIVTTQEREYPDSAQCMAYDLSGKPLLSKPYRLLSHTDNPRILYACDNNDGLFGFLHLDSGPEQTQFIYRNLIEVFPATYIARLDSSVVLVTPEGNRLYTGPLAAASRPNEGQIKRFKETKGTAGALIIALVRQDFPPGMWIGLNELGQEFLFEVPDSIIEDVAPAAPPKTNPPPAKEEVIEVERVVEPPPVIEQPALNLRQQEVGTGGGKIYTLPEKLPQFPGGEPALNQFLADNLKYPVLARENGIQGKVALTFIVETDGSLTTIQLLRDIGGGCGKEAIRLLKSMPKWLPGEDGGQKVRTKFTLPVAFRL